MYRVTKDEIDRILERLKDLETMNTQNAKLIEQLAIIIKGSSTFGTRGIHETQSMNESFQRNVMQEIASIKSIIATTIDTKAAEIMQRVDDKTSVADKKMEEINKGLNSLKDWKGAWDNTIDLMTNSKVWKVVFIILLGFVGLVFAIKARVFDFLTNMYTK